MGSPQPADLSQTLDGLLTGLDSLMAQRDRPVSEPTPIESLGDSGHARPLGPSRAPLLQNAVPFLTSMTALAAGGLQTSAPAGVAEASLQVLRQQLMSRCIDWCSPGHAPVLLSPRWSRLLKHLPAGSQIQSDSDPRFLLLDGPGLPDLPLRRAWAGPVGQTIHRRPDSARGFRLPVLPEFGGVVTAEARGYSAARWTMNGPTAVFFWLDTALQDQMELAGIALVGEGGSMMVLAPLD